MRDTTTETPTERTAGTTSGTTATLCLVNETRGEITCAYVGDSFAYLVQPPSSSGADAGRYSAARVE